MDSITDEIFIDLIDQLFLLFGFLLFVLIGLFYINRIKGSSNFEKYINYFILSMIVPFSIFFYFNLFIDRVWDYKVITPTVVIFILFDFLLKKYIYKKIEKRRFLRPLIVLFYYLFLLFTQTVIWSYAHMRDKYLGLLYWIFFLIIWFIFVVYLTNYEKQIKRSIKIEPEVVED